MSISVAEFKRRALGRFWSNRMHGLNYPLGGEEGDVIAEAIMDASVEADDHVRRRLSRPGATTVSANSTGSVINVASTIGLDVGSGDDSYVQVNNSALYKILEVDITNYSPPYPGTITVAPTIVGTISAGMSVQGVTKERTNVTGLGTNFNDGAGIETQEAQTAIAHSPHDSLNTLVRYVWVTSPPIHKIVSIGVILGWAGNVSPLPLDTIAVSADQGWIRLPIGMFVPPGSDVEIVYIGGYQQLSRSMQSAITLLAADNLASGLAPLATGYATAEVGGSRVSTTTKARRGRMVDDEVTTLRGMALQKLDPHIRLTP